MVGMDVGEKERNREVGQTVHNKALWIPFFKASTIRLAGWLFTL